MKQLGDHILSKYTFPNVEKRLRSKSLQGLPVQQKSAHISKILLELIHQAPSDSFVLIPVMDFIEQVVREKIVDHYSFSTFELWLNQNSGLSFQENLQVRGKIAGRFVPREEYQVFFPLGMGRVYPGCHFVTAHGSPDLDTTVASFWGWVDAFAARVSEGMHFWNVPGGAPASSVEISFLFYKIFGEGVFSLLGKSRTTLSVSSLELMTQHEVVRKDTEESMQSPDSSQAVILIDKEGYYLGEWRNIDIEKVRHVINLFNQCLRWYENNLHVKLIALFAKENFTRSDFADFRRTIFGMTIEECEPVREFSDKQKELIRDYLVKVFHAKAGIGCTIQEFAKAMQKLHIADFQEFIEKMESLEKSPLFDSAGKLKENRSQIFNFLAKIIESLDKAIYTVRLYVERLDVALKVKTSVLGIQPQYVTFRADYEEIRSKIDNFPYLTVTAPESEGRMAPLGIVLASDIFKPIVGTVTLRDFSNREETKIPPYLDVISVIDHHKSTISTSSPPVAYITDSQSCNSLVAQLSFTIHDRYSTGGMSLAEIKSQMRQVEKDLSKPSHKRVMQRLLQRQLVVDKEMSFYVSPERERIEYTHYLYAIIDDTDLLTKISPRDIECVASLLNRLKSLSLKKEVEIINFDDLSRDEHFAAKAAARILQNDDMYSLYCKIYRSKEESAEKNLKLCASGKPSTIFADTKEQNGCCRVSQTKLFSKNFPFFEKHAMDIRRTWVESCKAVHKEKSEIDLHMHMISTIAGAEDLYTGAKGKYKHKDEIWIWIPTGEAAIEHLKSFLNSFRLAPHAQPSAFEIEFLGENAKELQQIFAESFNSATYKSSNKGVPIAVMRFTAGTINSRKAMISPYLPHMI